MTAACVHAFPLCAAVSFRSGLLDVQTVYRKPNKMNRSTKSLKLHLRLMVDFERREEIELQSIKQYSAQISA